MLWKYHGPVALGCRQDHRLHYCGCGLYRETREDVPSLKWSRDRKVVKIFYFYFHFGNADLVSLITEERNGKTWRCYYQNIQDHFYSTFLLSEDQPYLIVFKHC